MLMISTIVLDNVLRTLNYTAALSWSQKHTRANKK
eukprot:XP_001706614.1 Hypothetical protein GL50803_26727 [Giardia lamblia ATCC 50803]